MSPSDRAKELVEKFMKSNNDFDIYFKDFAKKLAKRNAIICINEMIDDQDWDWILAESHIKYLEEIKSEIEKL